MCVIKQRDRKQIQSKQHGFVLVLALVLLAVMTLIGVSSMNSATMELKATANARQHQLAFNAVQSLLQYVLSTGAVTTAGVEINYKTAEPAATLTQVVDHPATDNNSQASIVFAGCSSGVGSSLEEGKGVSYNFYNVSASGSNTTNTSRSLQNIGVKNMAAAC